MEHYRMIFNPTGCESKGGIINEFFPYLPKNDLIFPIFG